MLWHLSMSHYNEKVRWALDHKRLPHIRRAVAPGVHQLLARRLGTGATLPVLVLDGVAIGESAAIIAALEERVPVRPLYPADDGRRRTALELEAHLDGVLAPAIRRAFYQEALEDRAFATAFLAAGGPPSRRWIFRAAFPAMVPAMRDAFAVPERSDPRPRETVRAELDRLGKRIGQNGYLVGDTFTIADLTACSFLIPLLDIAAMPAPLPALIEPLERFGRELAATDGGQWAIETYRRHRLAT